MKLGTDLTQGSVAKKYVFFLIPIILSGIIQQLYNTADTMVVGMFAGDTALAAVGSTSSLTNLILHLFLGLSVGTNVVCARLFGADNKDGLQKAIHSSILLALVSGIFLAFIGYLYSRPLLKLLGTPSDVIDGATLYMQVIFLGSPASMLYNFGAAILRAAGDTKRPLYILITAGLVNVGLNLVCVIGFKMGVLGVALGTIASQIFSAIAVLWILLHTESEFKLFLKKLRFHPRELGRIAATGIPSGLNGIMFSLSNVIIQSAINSFGKAAIAGSAAASNIEAYGFLLLSAAEQGLVSFVGQNMGAKKYNRVSTVTKTALVIAFISSLLFLLGIKMYGETLIGLFTDNNSRTEVIKMGIIKLEIVAGSYILLIPNQILNGVLKGMGRAVVPTVINAFCVCVLRMVWMFAAYPLNPTLNMVYTAYPISWATSSIAISIAYIIIQRKVFKTKTLEQ